MGKMEPAKTPNSTRSTGIVQVIGRSWRPQRFANSTVVAMPSKFGGIGCRKVASGCDDVFHNVA